jgi:hypothetical protein
MINYLSSKIECTVWKDNQLLKQMHAKIRLSFKHIIAAFLIPLLTIYLFQIIAGLAGIVLRPFWSVLFGVLGFGLALMYMNRATIDIEYVEPGDAREPTLARGFK